MTVDVYGDYAVVAPAGPADAKFPMVPLSTSRDGTVRAAASLWLRLLYQVRMDDEREHLAVQTSVFALCVSKTTGSAPFRIEYDRDKTARQPAHVQIEGDSAALGAAFALAGQPIRRLHQLHIPLGGRRFRPSLEDFIEFLQQEKLVSDLEPGWQDVLANSRGGWEERQARATVRRFPDAAAAQLERMGYTVTHPTA